MGRKRRNNVYRHYMLQEESQTSTCLLCYKTLNSTHGSNLMNHLKFMHKIEYQHILALNNEAMSSIATARVSQNSNDEDSNQSDLGLDVDVDRYFSMERGSNRVRCDICQASVEKKGSNLMLHLKREHPKELKPSNDSDADDQEDNLYQEVVYLYDSDSKSTQNVRSVKLSPATPAGSQRQRTKHQSNQFKRQSTSIDNRKRRRVQETVSSPVDEFTEELNNFGKYVTCLMKTIPKDLCAQLQMDIINLIMTAKIKNMSKSESNKDDSNMPVVVEKIECVSVGSRNQSMVVTEDASNLDNSSVTSDSNVDEISKTDNH